MDYLTLSLVVILMSAITLAANLSFSRSIYQRLVFIGVAFINLALVLNLAALLLLDDSQDFHNIPLGIALYLLTILIATALLFEPIRTRLSRYLPPPQADDPAPIPPAPTFEYTAPLLSEGERFQFPISTSPQLLPTAKPKRFKELRGFSPRNLVHMLAMIFCVYMLGIQLANFVLSGGLSGVAEDTKITFQTLIANFIPLLLVPVLGVGLFSKRSFPQVLERLGLANPSLESIGIGIAAGVVLFIAQVIMVMIWVTVAGIESVEEQSKASSAISESINTIWLALGVALTASIGEEIAFRGSLQPIFGLWPTAAFFTLIHMQYTLTPAAIIIFVVSLGLGYLRRHFNLYAAIFAHFFYNFIPLFLQQLIR